MTASLTNSFVTKWNFWSGTNDKHGPVVDRYRGVSTKQHIAYATGRTRRKRFCDKWILKTLCCDANRVSMKREDRDDVTRCTGNGHCSPAMHY